MVRQLGTNAKRLERLVEQMLDLDKIANGSYSPSVGGPTSEALVGRVAEETPDIANRDLKIAAEHVAIEVDPGLTEQMVETLLSNAGRRTAPGGKIWVTVVPDQDGAVIAVDDASPEAPPAMPSDRETAGSRPQQAPGLRSAPALPTRRAARRPGVGRGARGRRCLVPRVPAERLGGRGGRIRHPARSGRGRRGTAVRRQSRRELAPRAVELRRPVRRRRDLGAHPDTARSAVPVALRASNPRLASRGRRGKMGPVPKIWGLSKQQANYRTASKPTVRCKTCTYMFPRLSIGGCRYVRGVISDSATCDEFAPRSKPTT